MVRSVMGQHNSMEQRSSMRITSLCLSIVMALTIVAVPRAALAEESGSSDAIADATESAQAIEGEALVGDPSDFVAELPDGDASSDDVSYDSQALTYTDDDVILMYRLYNKVTSEHLYTSSTTEVRSLTFSLIPGASDWVSEGIGWCAPKSGNPVYRLYNPGLGDHHYTTSKTERDSLVRNHGWNYEGVGWYSAGTVPLYRQYNSGLRTGQHNYTKNIGEQQILVARHGWKAEGIGWYGVDAHIHSWQQTGYEYIDGKRYTAYKCSGCGDVRYRRPVGF